MSDLEAGLFRCPPPLRKPLAEKLLTRGVRMDGTPTVKLVLTGPENLGNWRPGHLEALQVEQAPHAEKLQQVRALANTLVEIPRKELRPAIANDLYQLGGRVHPELATVEVPEQATAPRHDPFDIVKQFAPALAEQMQAATTDADREALIQQIRHEHGSRIAEIASGIDNLDQS